MKKKMMWVLSLCLAASMEVAAQQLPDYRNEALPVEQRIEDALARMTLGEKIAVIHAQSKFSSPGVPRLGMPTFWTDDGPHGVRPDVLWDEWEQAGCTNDSCVAFPALTCLAASWNPEMAHRYGVSLGEEARYRGKDMMLGPGVNIYRTPLGGRNFEYMGEDPWLAARMCVPYVEGLQSLGVSACVKHFALNNDEENRHTVNVVVNDRALRELYLPAFEAAVKEGKTWGIMGAYNYYRNQHNCHNDWMLNKLLKGEWQYDGVVVSDWGGTHDTEEAITNGLDMEFGSWTDGLTMGATNAYDRYYLAEPYKQLINEGKYTTRELDEKVRRVLRLFFRTTLRDGRPLGSMCSEAHYATARQVAAEGIVLLQNQKVGKAPVLPINADGVRKVLVVGENAIKMMTVGGGSSSLKVQHEISPLDGLRARLAGRAEVVYERGYVGDVTGDYNGVTTGQDLSENRTADELVADAVAKAKEADVVIFVGGLNKADFQDCEGHDRRGYALPYGQDRVIEALAKANPRLVVVNISGNAVAMPWVKQVPAIVQGWFLGSEAGTSLAAVLCGDTNPSGHLPFTWFACLEDVPAHHLNAFPGEWRKEEKIIDEEYKEGLYVGYRWADLPKAQKVRVARLAGVRSDGKVASPLFAFGHGLSYTTFALSGASADKQVTTDGKMAFTVNVKNTGNRAGSEVVQLYVSDVEASVDRPVKELKAFRKVFLQPGESKDVTLAIDRRALSFWDVETNDWKAEPGEFEALIGTASDKIVARVKFALK